MTLDVERKGLQTVDVICCGRESRDSAMVANLTSLEEDNAGRIDCVRVSSLFRRHLPAVVLWGQLIYLILLIPVLYLYHPVD